MTLTKFATACAVFAGAAQGLKLQSLALVPITVHRVEQYPNLNDYEAPDGLLATEGFTEYQSYYEGKYENFLRDAAPSGTWKKEWDASFWNLADFPGESKVDGRLDKIQKLMREYGWFENGVISETMKTVYTPLTQDTTLWTMIANPEIDQAVYKDAACFINTAYMTWKIIDNSLK